MPRKTVPQQLVKLATEYVSLPTTSFLEQRVHAYLRTFAEDRGLTYREDRLGNTAASLTFTTLIGLVPLFTLLLALFSALPMFAQLQTALQQWLAGHLIPEPIARQVMAALTQFGSRARGLGLLGGALFVLAALALWLTMARTLNTIWRVRRPRPLALRVLIGWAALTLGPLLLAGALVLGSQGMRWMQALLGRPTLEWAALTDLSSFAVLWLGTAALYHYLPNCPVRWRDALAGGLLAAAGLLLAQALLVGYLRAVPAYTTIYGAFAAVPVLLLWIYLAWLMVLFGAVTAAYLPTLLGGVAWRADAPGAPFRLALAVLRRLADARAAGQAGETADAMSRALRADPLELAPVLEQLLAMDWVARLEDGRHALLVDPVAQPLRPLVQALLLGDEADTAFVWDLGLTAATRLADVWPGAPVAAPSPAAPVAVPSAP